MENEKESLAPSEIPTLTPEQLAEVAEITKNDEELRRKPYPHRLALYLKQRFDPGENIPLVVMLFGSMFLLFSDLLLVKNPLFSLQNFFISLAVLSFFFNLRVYDEFKDAGSDQINFPDRVVVRGIFKLEELKLLGIASGVFGLLVSLWFGKELALMCLVINVYSFLMAKEFFLGEWLEQRLILYAVTHMVIIPLIAIYCAVAVDPQVFTLGKELASVALCLFCFVFSLEVGRKIRTPEDERPRYITYSKILGMKGAVGFVFSLQAAALLLYAPLLFRYTLSAGAFIALAYLLTYIGCLKVLQKPTIQGARDLKKTCALPFIVFLIATMINFWR